MKVKSPSESGAALIVAMLLVVVVGSLTTTLTNRTAVAAVAGRLHTSQAEVRVAAEGGLATLVARLNDRPMRFAERITVGRVEVAIAAEPLDSQTVRLTATASAISTAANPRVTKTIESEVELVDGRWRTLSVAER
jgi:type II secretory pathway component PulK